MLLNGWRRPTAVDISPTSSWTLQHARDGDRRRPISTKWSHKTPIMITKRSAVSACVLLKLDSPRPDPSATLGEWGPCRSGGHQRAKQCGHLPGSIASVFGEPDDFQAALREDGVLSLLVTGNGPFRARLTQVALDHVHLSAGD